ncbi:MAG: PaaI family thioesterase [Bacteroidetes bacterium]|jgi:acyl-coenzyme A thioesterase PaaI-like protein|nr:PaaI family thioesterase [Bacteroidota bacterium]MBT3748926.1 PaaI family thioesterase [Bacteroidota bacterium]MBT4398581.1 PaaI family thioesterase [Bacteroidota bacterium]MBT4409092.1 PaaI family thioesterase [Bacteroidota bacterium]MBT7094157.1 PaaI family thioesterase [Bacteroidota bacterium]
MKALQDYYPENFAHCYGCGRMNEHGHQIKTYWDGDQTRTLFTPEDHHIAIPGYVYGGILASIIDCLGTGTGSLALARERQTKLTEYNAPRCVTASLKVDYQKPTPMGTELEVRGEIREIKGRKVHVDAKLFANGVLTVTGEIIVIEVSENFGR